MPAYVGVDSADEFPQSDGQLKSSDLSAIAKLGQACTRRPNSAVRETTHCFTYKHGVRECYACPLRSAHLQKVGRLPTEWRMERPSPDKPVWPAANAMLLTRTAMQRILLRYNTSGTPLESGGNCSQCAHLTKARTALPAPRITKQSSRVYCR